MVKAPANYPSVADRAAAPGQLMTSGTQSSSGEGSTPIPARSLRKPCTSIARNMDVRAGIKVVTWNVLTLNRAGVVTAIVRTLEERILAGLTKARLKGNDSTLVGREMVLHSGGTTHTHGVALVVPSPLSTNLTKWSPVNGRLLQARLTIGTVICHSLSSMHLQRRRLMMTKTSSTTS